MLVSDLLPGSADGQADAAADVVALHCVQCGRALGLRYISTDARHAKFYLAGRVLIHSSAFLPHSLLPGKPVDAWNAYTHTAS